MTLIRELIEAVHQGEEPEGWRVVDQTDWKAVSKYQTMDYILEDLKEGKYFKATISRTGSPYTDWHYEYPNQMMEVIKAEKTVTYWKKA